MKPQSEAAFQQQVVNLAGFYGWSLVYHTHDSRRSQPGFPDLVLVRAPELVFAELKAETGVVKPEQQDWIDALQVVGRCVALALAELGPETARELGVDDLAVEAHIWKPSDFDAVHTRLARGRRRVPVLYRDEAAA